MTTSPELSTETPWDGTQTVGRQDALRTGKGHALPTGGNRGKAQQEAGNQRQRVLEDTCCNANPGPRKASLA